MTNTELLQAIYDDVQNVKLDLQSVKVEIHDVKAEVRELKTEIANVKSDVQLLKADVQELNTDMEHVKSELYIVKERVSLIESTLELETNRNIKIIAEGHFDLSRKLDRSLLSSSQVHAHQELQDIYINLHESKLRELYKKVG